MRTPEDHLGMYRRMALIRAFETRASRLYKAGDIPGFLHLSIGQEATAVGACWHLEDRDVITSTHRGHGHCIAKGMDPAPMMAELMGRETGTCKGRGGSMHIADPSKGVFGANGIVGAGLPIATGAATASQLRADGSIALAFFGDGSVAQGMFHEAVNLAAVWELPIVLFCENNHYAEFSPAQTQTRGTLADRAKGYGIPYRHVDGNDVVAVADLVEELLVDLRRGSGPVLVEAETYRWHGHYEGDPERYRTPGELDGWKARDPLTVLANRLDTVVPKGRLEAIDLEVTNEVDTAVEAARSAPWPAATSLTDFVTVVRPDTESSELAAPEGGEVFRTMDAVSEALREALEEDPSVYLAGIDVGAGGNVFGLTRGLSDSFPGRVRDTPISETAILGSAIGAAMAGMRPIVEIMYMDFIGVCFDMLLNQMSKLRFMTGGNAQLPLVVRTQFGAGRSSGSQHSQSLEALLAHIPGLTVVMPSNPAETYGLLRSAIADPNPVIFVENRIQYGKKAPRPPQGTMIPLGRANVVRTGKDVTLVSYSRMLGEALQAAEEVSAEGISVEVIDLRTIAPLDRATILESFAKTNRLVVAHEAVQDFGVGAEIAAMAVDEGFWHLDAPVLRVGARPTPAPYSPPLEQAWLPDATNISEALRKVAAV